MHRLLPDGVTGRFALLLLASLLFCNLAAAFIIAREGTAFDAAIRMQRDMGRLVSLVESIEESDYETGLAILSRSTTGYTRFSIDSVPVGGIEGERLQGIVDEIQKALPGNEIRVTRGNPVSSYQERGPALMLISVKIAQGARVGEWLNSLAFPLAPTAVWGQKWAFFVPLIASLATSLIVGLLIIQQMSKPLKRLAAASLVAGQGDHSIRVAETGPREIREAARAFNTMQHHISEFEASRRQILASIGHDLRTPLTCLRIRAEVVRDNEQRAPMIQTLDEMSVMVEDILTFSRETASPEPRQDLDLNSTIRTIASERGLPFVAGAPLTVSAQPVAIGRAVGNLVDNALRYAGGAELSLTRSEATALISVRDRGPGIEEDRLDDLLKPFVRGEYSRSRETGGLGLGLAIARDIATGHGGTLTLRNMPDGGLSAEISLPYSQGSGTTLTDPWP